MTKRIKWPKEVPVLEASNFCKGDLKRGSRRCLVGWTYEVFGTCTDPCMKVFDMLQDEVGQFPHIWNDSERTSKDDIANVWNRTMAKLGYTEDC